MSESITLDVAGELITVDEAFCDFSDLTPAEIRVLASVYDTAGRILDDDGEPTPLGVAFFIWVKLARSRDWDRRHFDAVMPLLVSWLTGTLEEVTA